MPKRVLSAAIAFTFMMVMSGCGGDARTNTTTEQAATNQHDSPHQQRLKPARMLPPDSSPYGEAIIGPVRNGWVAEGRTTTIVYAGGQGYGHPDRGKFLIHRDGFGPRTDSIYVDRAGAIKITKAPLGRKALGPAQRHGTIEFTSTNGVSGTLHLKDDTVTLNTREQHPRGAESGAQRLQPCRPGGPERFHGRLLPGIPDGLGATADNLGPQTNMWLMHVCHHFTAVGAGADPDHRADGRFTIYRRGERPARGAVKTVEVPGAGALTIIKAPVGRKVVTRGQEPDAIQFKSKSGISGTLHLSDDSVILDQ